VSAKDIILKPITSAEASALVRRIHYSKKVAPNSQIHIGVFYNGKLEGALQFGPPMDKRKTQNLVKDTPWNGFIELNRMAFSDALPRNSESRAIAIAFKMLKKHAPHLEWVISFADGTQCGDGTIYRASGFVLTGIKKNTSILRLPNGEIIARKTLDNANHAVTGKNSSYWKKNGAEPLVGYQLRYVYFLKPEAKERLSVPILPFDEIEKVGARMYKGSRPGSIKSDASDSLSEDSGATPTSGLHPKEESDLSE